MGQANKWEHIVLQTHFLVNIAVLYVTFPEFTQDVTDIQMANVAPVILPQMYKIFMQHEVGLLAHLSYSDHFLSVLQPSVCPLTLSNNNSFKAFGAICP